MNKLLIATHNPAKKQELRHGLMPLTTSGIDLVFLDDLHITLDPEETGKTFFDNAKLKAEYFAALTQMPVIADDGGIEIDALGGEPGVHSKRWLGRDANDDELVAYTLQRLHTIPMEKRTAHFRIVLYYHNPLSGENASSDASLNGRIALKVGPDAKKGFPYRSLFIVDKYGVYYDELDEAQHKEVNHRLLAVQKLIPLIKKDLLQ